MTELELWNKTYLERRAKYEELDQQTKQAKSEMESAERCLIEAMNTAGVIDFKNEDGVSFGRRDATKYSCLAGDRAELLNRLEADGYRDAFTINPQTLSGMMAEMAANNEGELPDRYKDLIQVFPQTKISVRGRKRG